jgi:hypothetical protein
LAGLTPVLALNVSTNFQIFSEKHRERISFILAGYEKEMTENLFSYNSGLKSRFEIVHLENFHIDQLMEMWKDQVERKKFSYDKKAPFVVRRRILKLMQKKGFANGWEVHKEVCK